MRWQEANDTREQSLPVWDQDNRRWVRTLGPCKMSTSTTTASVASTSALTTSEAEALKASVFQRLHPRIYYERFLEERVRPDGREFDAWRDVAVNVGTSSASEHGKVYLDAF